MKRLGLIKDARQEASLLQGARIRDIRDEDRRRLVRLLRDLACALEDSNSKPPKPTFPTWFEQIP